MEDNGKKASWMIARTKYGLGKDNYIGLLYSGREFAGEYNRVLATDAVYRLGKFQRIKASFLQSFSGRQEGRQGKAKNSSSMNLGYNYEAKHLYLGAAYEHIGKDFRMDSAYILRTGINNYYISSGFAFYPDPQKIPWLRMMFIRWELFFTRCSQENRHSRQKQ